MQNKYLRYVRYLTHPYLLWRTVLRYFEVRESQKHIVRLQEYDSFSSSFESFIESLTNKGNHVSELTEELINSPFLTHIDSCLKESGRYGGSMTGDLGTLLYILIRISHPKIVVETGVANGFSSAFILKALRDNQKGKLYSVDLHLREGVAVPPGKQLGWVIPDELRDRWTLKLGESTKVLPRLLKQLGEIDVFLHDSRHLYKTMMAEYKIAWPYIKPGGLLLSDDVRGNDALIDFANYVQPYPVVFKRVGGIQKDTMDMVRKNRILR